MIGHVGVELGAGIRGGTTQQWWAWAAGPQRLGAAQPTRLQPPFQLCSSILGTGGPAEGMRAGARGGPSYRAGAGGSLCVSMPEMLRGSGPTGAQSDRLDLPSGGRLCHPAPGRL